MALYKLCSTDAEHRKLQQNYVEQQITHEETSSKQTTENSFFSLLSKSPQAIGCKLVSSLMMSYGRCKTFLFDSDKKVMLGDATRKRKSYIANKLTEWLLGDFQVQSFEEEVVR